jgi:hypothetical protein
MGRKPKDVLPVSVEAVNRPELGDILRQPPETGMVKTDSTSAAALANT